MAFWVEAPISRHQLAKFAVHMHFLSGDMFFNLQRNPARQQYLRAVRLYGKEPS